MLFSLSSAILLLSTTTILASPAVLQHLHSRETPSAGQPGVYASVISSNGTDVSSHFPAFLYLPEGELESNLTERGLSPLETRTGFASRPIDTCRSLNAQFRMSMCDYHAGRQLTMQRYLVQCSMPPGRYNALNPRLITEWGSCNRDEICINGEHDEHGLPSMAKCVNQRLFQPLPNYDTPAGQDELHDYLVNRMVYAVMSHPDKETPMSVESFSLEAGRSGSSGAGGQVGPTSQEQCEDCVEVGTNKLAQGTDFLSTQAKVVGGVSAGVAGVLWMAALSG